MEAYMVWVWLAAFVLAIIIEACTQEFVSIWFAVGSLVSLIINTLVPIWAEVIIFAIVSFVALILTRPLVKKMTERSARYTNVDEFVGKRVKVNKAISKFIAGEVKINGIEYTAILMENSDEEILEESIVEIVALKGNKVVVKKID
ncbi:MAG: NfeD family protein [Acholeplasmatales bacterium]|nr:NfeD family protein [Acholeplasmatales bacterium]